MNREIKFRGISENGTWIYGYYSCDKELHYIDVVEEVTYLETTAFALSRYEVEGETVGQFTGLTDKNGNDIYEGDVIKMGDNPECWFAPRVVEFKNGAWIGGSCRIYTNQDHALYEGDSDQNNWEIIGNIHQNPELLTDKK